jgi:hypothetical protein
MTVTGLEYHTGYRERSLRDDDGERTLMLISKVRTVFEQREATGIPFLTLLVELRKMGCGTVSVDELRRVGVTVSGAERGRVEQRTATLAK